MFGGTLGTRSHSRGHASLKSKSLFLSKETFNQAAPFSAESGGNVARLCPVSATQTPTRSVVCPHARQAVWTHPLHPGVRDTARSAARGKALLEGQCRGALCPQGARRGHRTSARGLRPGRCPRPTAPAGRQVPLLNPPGPPLSLPSSGRDSGPEAGQAVLGGG